MENISKPNRLQRVFHLCRWNSVDYKDTITGEINGLFHYPEIEFKVSEKDYSSYGNSLVETVKTSEDFDYRTVQTNGFSRPVLVERDTDICIPKKLLNAQLLAEFYRRDLPDHFQLRVPTLSASTQQHSDNDFSLFALVFEQNVDPDCMVTSFEFSGSGLDGEFKRPKVLEELDLIERAWLPSEKLKQCGHAGAPENSYYPKVQNILTMMPEGGFWDFHVEMGGASSWYHVCSGCVNFFLIKPSRENLNAYKKWLSSEEQSVTFLADLMKEDVEMTTLYENQTLYIPSGCIYAVYSVNKSICYSGLFVHAFDLKTQLKVIAMEESLSLSKREKFPHLVKLLWFVLDHYVFSFDKKTFLIVDHAVLNSKFSTSEDFSHKRLTRYEIEGLRELADFLEREFIKGEVGCFYSEVIKDVRQPFELMIDLRRLLELQSDIDSVFEPDGVSVLVPWDKHIDFNSTHYEYSPEEGRCKNCSSCMKFQFSETEVAKKPKIHNMLEAHPKSKSLFALHVPDPTRKRKPGRGRPKKFTFSGDDMLACSSDDLMDVQRGDAPATKKKGRKKKEDERKFSRDSQSTDSDRSRDSTGPRKRCLKIKGRCGECVGCLAVNCGKCDNCRDMRKFGGPGVRKQACIHRRCRNYTYVANKNFL